MKLQQALLPAISTREKPRRCVEQRHSNGGLQETNTTQRWHAGFRNEPKTLHKQTLREISSGAVVAACINSPSRVTLPGNSLAIDESKAELKETGVIVKQLKVGTAFRLEHMAAFADDYLHHFRAVCNQYTGSI